VRKSRVLLRNNVHLTQTGIVLQSCNNHVPCHHQVVPEKLEMVTEYFGKLLKRCVKMATSLLKT